MNFFANKKLQLIKEQVDNKSKVKRYIQFCFVLIYLLPQVNGGNIF